MTRVSTLIVLGAAAVLCAAPARAGQQEGVQCPSLHLALISNGNRNLVCKFNGLTRKKSICSPVAFNARGITVGAVVLDPVGRDGGIDQCVAPVTNQRVDSLMESMAPYEGPPTTVNRVVSPTGQDEFEVSYSKYAFPDGAMYGPGDARNGVSCPAGYDGDVRKDKWGDANGIRCDKLDGAPKTADCDIGWTVARDQNGNEDRCLGPLGLSEGPTKPAGMTKIQFDAERALPTVGWVLSKRSGADTWQRKVYAYPERR
jgi:hypothetical protein